MIANFLKSSAFFRMQIKVFPSCIDLSTLKIQESLHFAELGIWKLLVKIKVLCRWHLPGFHLHGQKYRCNFPNCAACIIRGVAVHADGIFSKNSTKLT